MEESKNNITAEGMSGSGGHAPPSTDLTLAHIPPPPPWIDKPFHEFQFHVQPDPVRHIAYPLIPRDKIPRGWSNDFEHYSPERYAWNEFYGGMQWTFNERYHIPGQPRLVLFEVDEYRKPKSGEAVLIEIGGQYLIHNYAIDDIIWVPDGHPPLEDILGYLRGETKLIGRQWSNDELSHFAQYSWHLRVEQPEE